MCHCHPRGPTVSSPELVVHCGRLCHLPVIHASRSKKKPNVRRLRLSQHGLKPLILATYFFYYIYKLYIYIYKKTKCYYRRKFRSQTSDNMDRWKAEQGRGREKRKIRRKNSRRERVRRKKMEMREKVGKSRNTVFFQWFGAPEGQKVGSLKRRVRSQLARWEMKNCTPLWREAHFQVKMYKTHHCRTTFGSCDVEKVHAVVARSTFPSQNVQNTSAPDHFWKLRCRKSARRCGAKHISKSKCTKHHMHAVCATFGGSDVEKVHAVVARSTFRSRNVQNTTCSRHFWRFGCRFAASLHDTTLRYITPHSTILHYITLHYTPQHYNYNYTTRLHSTTLHYINLHYATLHNTTLHYTTLH